MARGATYTYKLSNHLLYDKSLITPSTSRFDSSVLACKTTGHKNVYEIQHLSPA